MSGRLVEKAASPSHPLAVADATGLTNIHRIALTGVAQSIAIPASWQGRFCLLTVDSTADVQYAFSAGAAATLVLDQAAAIGTGSAAAGATIFAGGAKDARIRIGCTHINFIASAAGGFLEVEVSETP
jgi:hypothetical protein